MNAIHSDLTIPCRSEVIDLWGVLTDTERINRALGLSKIVVAPLGGAGAARFLVNTSLGGLPVEYEERPFEWLYPKRFRVLRRVRKGPLRSLEVSFELEAREGGGSLVRFRLTLEPRHAILAPFVRFMGGMTMRSFDEVIRGMDASVVSRTGSFPAARRSRAHMSALSHAEIALREAERDRIALADRLITFVRDAADLDVSRIRPFELADEWNEPRQALLGVCLSAVRAGLLDLRWEIVCPSCRIATEVLPSLTSLSDHGGCQLCELQFAVDLEDAVEATFAAAKAVREIDVGPYCIGGPARTPHVLAQAILPRQGEATLACPEEEGRYRLFVRGGAAAPIEVKAGAPARASIADLESARAEPIEIAPGGSLVIQNPEPEERHAKIERLAFVDQAARARVVTSMPGFRRDFSHDILRPGMALKVARVGLFFSDLTGSTQLYSTAGDAAAFKLVHDHFDVVVGLIEKGRGTLVKTIGDAVMAVFSDDLDGLAASVAVLHAFEDFRRGGEHRQLTHIKLGVFGGPCYVVTANGVLDYFGQTVNIAARLQAEARSGELIVEEQLADRAIELSIIPAAFVRERYAAALKGVASPIRAARIRVGE